MYKLFIILIIFFMVPYTAHACCSCAGTVEGAESAAWEKTLDVFTKDLEEEIRKHELWIIQTWWAENVEPALKGVAATTTTQQASSTFNELKRAEHEEMAGKLGKQAKKMAQVTLDYAPSEVLNESIEKKKGNVQAELDTYALTTMANQMLKDVPYDPTGKMREGLAKQGYDLGGGKPLACDLEGMAAGSPDCQKALNRLAFLAPNTGDSLKSIPEGAWSDPKTTVAAATVEARKNLIGAILAQDITGGFGGSYGHRLAKQAADGLDPNTTVMTTGEGLPQLERIKTNQSGDELSRLLNQLSSARKEELLTALTVIEKTQL